LHEQLHRIYFSPNIIRVIKLMNTRWYAHVARIGEMVSAKKNSVGKLEVQRLLERPRRTWENNTKVGSKEIE